MRRISAQIEALGSARFVLLIGLVAGSIQGIPPLLLGGARSAGLRLIPFLVIGGGAVLWWVAALLLWWVALHRQQSALWMIAAQITVGLVFGDLVHFALAAVPAGINTHGQFTAALIHEPSTFLASNLQLSLMRSPIWFVGALVAIAMGRHLNDRTDERSAATAPTYPDSVT